MATKEAVDNALNGLIVLLEGNEEDRKLLDERMRFNGIYVMRGVSHSDAEPEVREELDKTYRWGQIGAHEYIARREASKKNIQVRYSGPEATVKEREQALADFRAEKAKSAE